MLAVLALDGSATAYAAAGCLDPLIMWKTFQNTSLSSLMYVCMDARMACAFQSPQLKCLAERHSEVTDAMPSLEGDCSLSGLTSFRVLFVRCTHTHTQRRALTSLSYTQLHQSVSAQSNTISWPPIHVHQTFSDTNLSESHFFFSALQMQREEKRRREKVTLPISPAPVLACLTYRVFLWKCLEVYSPLKRYPTACVAGGWSWL